MGEECQTRMECLSKDLTQHWKLFDMMKGAPSNVDLIPDNSYILSSQKLLADIKQNVQMLEKKLSKNLSDQIQIF